jgi:uncharacterized protein (DUF488 family)
VHPLLTIGVYGWSLEEFLASLRAAQVQMLLDVRQRRGVRGPRYSWANSIRLQAALAASGIGYRHHRELAPTTELRHLQYAVDARQGVGKRSRVELAPAYRERYTREILNRADLAPVLSEVEDDGPCALFCVERDSEACHRSLIAERIVEITAVSIVHLVPGQWLDDQSE